MSALYFAGLATLSHFVGFSGSLSVHIAGMF